MTLSSGTIVRWVGKREIDAKLIAAAPRILEENRLMVTQMLEMVKADIQPGTPFGPGHFGVHLRDSYDIKVESKGVSTNGKLMAPPQGYWREFGTRGRHRGRNRRRSYVAAIGGFGTDGERAGLFATRALNTVRGVIRLYYGKAQWWRL